MESQALGRIWLCKCGVQRPVEKSWTTYCPSYKASHSFSSLSNVSCIDFGSFFAGGRFVKSSAEEGVLFASFAILKSVSWTVDIDAP